MTDTSAESATAAGESERRSDGRERCSGVFKKGLGRGKAAGSFLLLTVLSLAGCKNFSQMRMDAKIHRMCEKDGGIRVYETVRLPPEDFNRYGQINFYRPTQHENALGREYIWKDEMKTLYSEGEGLTGDDLVYALNLTRFHGQLYRRSDGKLLGEYISYIRRGGDSKFFSLLLGGPPPSSYGCPEIRGNIGVGMLGEIHLFKKIFIEDKGSGVGL